MGDRDSETWMAALLLLSLSLSLLLSLQRCRRLKSNGVALTALRLKRMTDCQQNWLSYHGSSGQSKGSR